MHEKRGILNFDRIPRGHTNRRRNSFRVPLQNQRVFLPRAPAMSAFAEKLFIELYNTFSVPKIQQQPKRLVALSETRHE
jgi:hypothetical protein